MKSNFRRRDINTLKKSHSKIKHRILRVKRPFSIVWFFLWKESRKGRTFCSVVCCVFMHGKNLPLCGFLKSWEHTALKNACDTELDWKKRKAAKPPDVADFKLWEVKIAMSPVCLYLLITIIDNYCGCDFGQRERWIKGGVSLFLSAKSGFVFLQYAWQLFSFWNYFFLFFEWYSCRTKEWGNY